MNNFIEHPLYGKDNADSAISALWIFYKKHFPFLFIVSLILSLITSYVSAGMDMNEIQSVTDPQEILLKMKEYIWPMLIISVISLFFSTILHYYVIYYPLDSQSSIIKCCAKSLRYFIPYLIMVVLLSFFGSFLLALGLIALVIGIFLAALYIFMIYLFILPVLMAEGPLIANAIVRIFRLAHKKFWTNLGWTAVFGVVLIIISVFLSGIILVPFSGTFLKTLSDPQNAVNAAELASNPLYIILSAMASALTFPVLPVFACILYFRAIAEEEKSFYNFPVTDEDENEGRIKVEDLYAKPKEDDDNTDK
ncbi:MAG: hypothetical protein RBR81_08720 [Bacteroidales bacterium]|jgi:hypothetical protein|nr:hypothetical protein [Bacteroidales bacterium]